MFRKPEKQESHFNDLNAVVAAMTDKTVLVVGDIMLDRFVYGDVHRISPESPVPVLAVRHELAMLGGAGNVLANLAGLGVTGRVVSVIGDDSNAEQVRTMVRERGGDPKDLIRVAHRPTTVKTRFLAAHQQLLRTDEENATAFDAQTEDEIIARAESVLPQASVVILSDYGKGVLSPRVIAATIKAAAKAGVPVLVDPKKADYAVYRGAAVVTPNRKELHEATGLPTGSDDEIVAAATALVNHAGIDAVVATRSQDGMSVIARKEKGRDFEAPLHLRTEAREVFDVSGAGDTVIATVAAGLAAGAPLRVAAAIANVAAGLVVAKVGTAPVRRAELLTALDRRDLDMATLVTSGGVADHVREAPVVSWDEGQEMVARWKARGLRVGFTNGCFDIIHAGHVFYLNRARDRCDRLVVGLNVDESISRLKGPERPVNDEVARAAVLAGLGAVDMIVMFGKGVDEEDKAVKIIERLKPDIYFKGGDYTEKDLPEAPVVRGYGGDVAIMPLRAGHSTSATIKKMKGAA